MNPVDVFDVASPSTASDPGAVGAASTAAPKDSDVRVDNFRIEDLADIWDEGQNSSRAWRLHDHVRHIQQMTYGPRTLFDRVNQVIDESENSADDLGGYPDPADNACAGVRP